MKHSNGSAADITPGHGQGDHKNMGLVLRVEVLKGKNLAPKDKSGTSDPFLVLTLGDAKQATSVIPKTLNPEWKQTFELPILTAESALLEAVCWDKDRFRNDYMGEFDVILEDIFGPGSVTPEPKWFSLRAKRSGKRKQKKDSNVSGEVLLKFTLYDPLNTAANSQQILQKFYGVVADSPDDDEEDDEDLLARINTGDLDDLSEEDDEKEPSDETDDGTRTPSGTPDEKQRQKRRRKIKKLKRKSKLKAYEFSNMSDVAGVLFLEINRITDLPPEKNLTRTTFDMDPFVVTSLGRKTYRTKVVRHNLDPVYDEKLVFQVQKHEVNYSLNFAVVDRDKFSGNDFVGTTNFPVEKVKALSPEADPETGLYKLPDADRVAPAGDSDHERKKRFRVSLSRNQSREALGRGSRNSSQTNLSKMTRSSSNSSLTNLARPALRSEVSSGSMPDQDRLGPTSAPTSGPSPVSDPNFHAERDAQIGQPQHVTDGDDPELYAYTLPLDLKKKERWEAKHNPTLYIRAKYLPYQALRQQFWRVMLRQYDADESGKIDKVELVTMLDTLGSTLHNSTIDGFFTRWKKQNNGEEVLTMDQAVICLEEQLQKSQETQKSMHSPSWKAKISSIANTHTDHTNNSSPSESPAGNTPYLGSKSSNLNPSTASIPALEVSDLSSAGEEGKMLPEDDLNATEAMQEQDLYEQDLQDDEGEDSSKEEHVVEIHECPICHQPRLARGKKTTDADIITHIATCASSDWRAVNNLVMAGFVTSSQAQRKWYSKVITKVGFCPSTCLVS